MAGYSSTPLPKKLGIAAQSRVALVSAPDGVLRTLGKLPSGVDLRRDLRSGWGLDVIVFFTTRTAELRRRFPAIARRLAQTGGFWVAWPKRASGVPTDLSDSVVREIGLATGLVDNKVCAIDEVWSGLRFVIRLRDRLGPRQS